MIQNNSLDILTTELFTHLYTMICLSLQLKNEGLVGEEHVLTIDLRSQEPLNTYVRRSWV